MYKDNIFLIKMKVDISIVNKNNYWQIQQKNVKVLRSKAFYGIILL